MYYYKFKEEAREHLLGIMEPTHKHYFLLHPEFVICRKTELDLNKGGLFKAFGLPILKKDIELAEAPTQIVFDKTNGNPIFCTPSFLHAFDYSGTYVKYGVFPLTDLRRFTTTTVTTTPIEDEYTESSLLSTSKYFVKDYLLEGIKHRYSDGNYDFTKYRKKIIIDSAIPSDMVNHNLNSYSIITKCRAGKGTKSSYLAISEFFQNYAKVDSVPIEDMIGMLGYTVDDIRRLHTKVSSQTIILNMVGTGGTGINTIYWLRKLLELIGNTSWVNGMYLIDFDRLEFSNLLRFPVDTNILYLHSTYKTGLASKLAHTLPYIANSTKILNERLLDRDTDGNTTYNGYIFNPDHSLKYSTEAKVINYGAPDLVTREALSNIGNFICATHADDSCSIWLNPSQDLDIQVESYGRIELGGFFMNQLKMTISLLEILSDNSLDLKEKDKHLLEYSFDSKNMPEATYDIRSKYKFIQKVS